MTNKVCFSVGFLLLGIREPDCKGLGYGKSSSFAKFKGGITSAKLERYVADVKLV